jgi:hypothetical protein
MRHHDAIFYREELSADGALHIGYNTMDGEKSPMVVEPCISIVSTGEVVFDLWRSGLNGRVEAASADGFRLTVTDNYGRMKVVVDIALRSRTFRGMGNEETVRPLAALEGDLLKIAERARKERLAALSLTEPASFSLTAQVKLWLTGYSEPTLSRRD